MPSVRGIETGEARSPARKGKGERNMSYLILFALALLIMKALN